MCGEHVTPTLQNMPVQRCTRNGEQGWQYGDSGKCYLASEEGSDDKAKQQAYLQGAAIEGGGPLHEEQKMAELDVPIIKKGVFNGMAVTDLKALVQDTLKAMPYLLEAQQTGSYRGKGNQRFNTETVPPFIHLRHAPEDIAFEKLKEWASDVNMELDTRLLLGGEEWGNVHFSNVDSELAKLLSVAFPYRSGEFLPNFENPDTGEIYPVVLRSVAFLDVNTEPAVPQQPGYSVKLAQNELGVIVVHCDVPNINQSQKETETMAEKEEAKTVKLSAEDIQRFEAMENRLKTLETENKDLKGAVNEMKEEKDSLSSQVLKFQQDAKMSQIEAFCMKLEHDYNLTEAAMQTIRPIVSAEDGVVKMSAEAEPIPLEQAYWQSFENLLKLAKHKDALFVPEKVNLPTGKQPIQKMSASEAREAEIKKVMEEKSLDYATARMQVVKMSNDILDRIDAADREGA